MTQNRFNPRGVVVVQVRLEGPAGSARVRMMLDTGSSYTVVRPTLLEAIGYPAEGATATTTVVTVSGLEESPVFRVAAIEALGVRRGGVVVVSHAIPAAAGVHGLLGLDFLRDGRLTIDFRAGTIDLD